MKATETTAAELADISNVKVDGEVADRQHAKIVGNVANQLWHSDSSFMNPRAAYSMLHAVVTPSWGGNTEFADMRAAYDALDDETKAEIEDMICEHSLMYSRGSLGFLDYTDEEKAMFKPVLQRLVRTHPVHGRKSLYLSSHAGAIKGMTMPEARLLLRELFAGRPATLLLEPGRLRLGRGRAAAPRGSGTARAGTARRHISAWWCRRSSRR